MKILYNKDIEEIHFPDGQVHYKLIPFSHYGDSDIAEHSGYTDVNDTNDIITLNNESFNGYKICNLNNLSDILRLRDLLIENEFLK